MRQIAGVFSSRTGRNVALMIAAAEGENEVAKAFRYHFILARRAEGKALLQAAIASGELREGIDLEVELDLIYAPLCYRLLVGHGALDEAFTDAVIDHALRGLQR